MEYQTVERRPETARAFPRERDTGGVPAQQLGSSLAFEGRKLVARSVAVMGLIGVALIHLLDAGGKYSETPYMFWMYLALIAGCLGAAALLVHRDSTLGWIAVGVLPAMTMIGYSLSRTIGLPGAMDDIGNWAEPLGLASLLIEGCLVALCYYRLAILPVTSE